MTRKVAGLIQFFWPGRRSSVVERRTRNAQVIGSSPIAGSSEVAEGPVVWAPPPLRWFLVDRTDDLRGGAEIGKPPKVGKAYMDPWTTQRRRSQCRRVRSRVI